MLARSTLPLVLNTCCSAVSKCSAAFTNVALVGGGAGFGCFKDSHHVCNKRWRHLIWLWGGLARAIPPPKLMPKEVACKATALSSQRWLHWSLQCKQQKGATLRVSLAAAMHATPAACYAPPHEHRWCSLECVVYTSTRNRCLGCVGRLSKRVRREAFIEHLPINLSV